MLGHLNPVVPLPAYTHTQTHYKLLGVYIISIKIWLQNYIILIYTCKQFYSVMHASIFYFTYCSRSPYSGYRQLCKCDHLYKTTSGLRQPFDDSFLWFALLLYTSKHDHTLTCVPAATLCRLFSDLWPSGCSPSSLQFPHHDVQQCGRSAEWAPSKASPS